MKKFTYLLYFLTAIAFAESPVQIDTNHSHLKATAQATGHSFEAVATKFQMDLTVNESTGTPETAKVRFNLADLKTGKEKRDTEMLHWLESEHYNDISFEFNGFTDSTNKTAKGTIAIHGVKKELEFPVNYELKDHQFTISGNFKIDTTDFGLKIIKKMLFLTVEAGLDIEFKVTGRVTHEES